MVLKMLNKTLDAYVEVDAKTALEVMDSDIEVDKLNTVVFQSLIEEMSEQEQLKIGPHLLLLPKILNALVITSQRLLNKFIFYTMGKCQIRIAQKQTSQVL